MPYLKRTRLLRNYFQSSFVV